MTDPVVGLNILTARDEVWTFTRRWSTPPEFITEAGVSFTEVSTIESRRPTDSELLTDFLTRVTPTGIPPGLTSATSVRYRVHTNMRGQGMVSTLLGGQPLIVTYDNDNSFVLNLDHAYMGAASDLRAMRAEIVRIAEEKGVDVIPVSRTALDRINYRGLVLIERVGMEGVFVNGDANYYLSGYDEQEEPPLYFLCRLPDPVSSVAEARESLKPRSVKLAEGAGIQVHRQGDLFFITSGLIKPIIKMRGGRIHKDRSLYGTRHKAEKVAVMPGGRMLAHGIVTHASDHHPLVLGPGWWWVAKNTVPVQPPR